MRGRGPAGGNRRVCIHIQGAKGPAGPLPLIPFPLLIPILLQSQKKCKGHKSLLQRSVALNCPRLNKIKVSNTGLYRFKLFPVTNITKNMLDDTKFLQHIILMGVVLKNP